MKREEFGSSGYGQLNFLWKDPDRPIYIMDNHLGALWCWLRELRLDDSYTLIHVDHHWDAMEMSDDSIIILRDHDVDNISDYLAMRSPTHPAVPLVRWDNYIDALPILRPMYKRLYFHAFQPEPQSRLLQRKRSDTSTSMEWWENLGYWEEELEDTRIVLNFDLDYFFLTLKGEHVKGFSDEFVKVICNRFISPLLQRDTILTVAWSPECCGGWRPVADISRLFCKELNIPFPQGDLPLPF
jgi:hypothetical protein